MFMLDRSNGITLAGEATGSPVFDHEVFGEAFYKFAIAVRRLSGTEDLIPVTVSERLLLCGEPSEGTPIIIDGQIRSYNRRAEDGSHLMITVFAREIAFPGEEVEPRNDAELFGHICKPVIYRTTPFSREIADILVAVNRRYRKSDYLPAIAWGRNARFAKGLKLGDPVVISGRLQSREYRKTLPDGSAEQRTAYEISCSSISSDV